MFALSSEQDAPCSGLEVVLSPQGSCLVLVLHRNGLLSVSLVSAQGASGRGDLSLLT